MLLCVQQEDHVHVVYELDSLGPETGALTETACGQARRHAAELRKQNLLAGAWYRIVLYDDEGRLLDQRVELA
jgi:hypothetical protein